MNNRLLIICGIGGASIACAGVAVHELETSASAAPQSQPSQAQPQTVTNAPAPAKTDANAVPILVELFTSEGCSSCPPADVVLANLERNQGIAGARVVPLGLHVDYWDRLGWTDPFSSARMTERQRSYSTLGSGSYTPQAVVDGAKETVGSRRAALELFVTEAAKRPHASLTIEVAPRTDAAAPFLVSLKIGALPAGSAADAEAVVALTQNAARVAIPRGENSGSTLEHTAIARELVVVWPAPAAGGSLKTSLNSPAGIAPKDLRIVAFVQERASRRVLGTQTRDLDAR